jgi:hypothetical protein
MTGEMVILSQRLQRLGYAPHVQMKLYGQIFEFVSEPIVSSHDLVFINGIERKSGRLRRIRIPLPVVRLAKER